MTNAKKKPIDWRTKLFCPSGKPRAQFSGDVWLQFAIAEAGSIAKLAEALGVTRQAIYGNQRQPGWKCIPPRLAAKASRLYGIPLDQLLPKD